MTDQNLLNQLVELTGNTCNAFTIALYKICLDDKALVLRHHVSLSSNFDPKVNIALGEGPIGLVAENKQPYLEENFKQNPKNLNGMIVNMGGSNAYTSTVRQGGAMELRFIAWAFWHSASNTNNSLKSLETDLAINSYNFENALNNWPIKKGLTPLSLIPNYERWAFDILTNTNYDEYWMQPGFAIDEYYDDHPDIPMIYVGGWYDSYTRATIENFVGLNKIKNSEVKLIIGPWTHGTAQPEITFSGDLEFGEDASIGSFKDFHLAWYNKWFKNTKTKDDSNYLYDAPIKIFVMGSGDGHKTKDGRIFHGGYWREETQWPLKDTNFIHYYMNNDNVLSKTKPNTNNSSTYIYDPNHPVPTIGANISSLAGVNPLPSGTKNPTDVPTALRRYSIVNPGGYNQKEDKQFYGSNPPYTNLSERQDVLSFQSNQLIKDTEITGPIQCVLYVSSDCLDTDFTAKLIDVYPYTDSFPEGFAFNLTDGILRMRYRDSFKQENFMTKNENSSLKEEEVGVLLANLSSSRGKRVGTLNLSFEERIRRDREAFRKLQSEE